MTEFAIVGLGAWGLSVLERTVSRARATGRVVRVHVVQPGSSSAGVYALDQPDFLVLNVACGQIRLYAAQDEGLDPPYRLSLHEWAVERGYRWVGHECRIGRQGAPIGPGDYLPRRLMGEYLGWFYDALVSCAPRNLEILRHVASAVDIVPAPDGREAVLLDDGSTITVDHVVLTSGHTWNAEPETRPGEVVQRRPYPVEYFEHVLPAGAPVAISGMGLVAFDLMAALTIGRGGRFAWEGDRLRYLRSGREPTISLYSRSGMPYCAKSAQATDPTGSYEPVVCTPDAFADLRRSGKMRPRHQVDFRREVQPLLFAEMQCRYLVHAALLAGGEGDSAKVRAQLGEAWREGTFGDLVDKLETRYGSFDPAAHVYAGSGLSFASSDEYESVVYSMLEDDLDAALAPGGSPVKAAQEVTRILRDQLRSVIEFGGLSLESYVDFQSKVRGRINRIEAGPPPARIQQMLALMDAGILHVPFGPSPEVIPSGDGRSTVRSTQLARMHASTALLVIRGHIEMPSLARSVSPLLSRLYTKGRLSQLTYGETPVGSVAIDEEFHPYDAEGRLQPHLSLLGVLTEGVRYFTHYLPSPQSRIRAVLDAQSCVEAIVG